MSNLLVCTYFKCLAVVAPGCGCWLHSDVFMFDSVDPLNVLVTFYYISMSSAIVQARMI